MCADEQPRSRFEPPPWEREAFERFQKERAEREAAEAARVAAELIAAERAAEQAASVAASAQAATGMTDTASAAPDGASATDPQPPTAITSVPGGVMVSIGALVAPPAQSPRPIAQAEAPKPAIPESQIQAMLIELRTQEPLPMRTNMPLVNTVIGVFVVLGVYIGAQALIWLAKGGEPDAPDFMLRAAASFLVFLAGVGFVGGAVMLYRKYHR